ncbi:MAG TPA: response regulator [Kofleriaceae bacterium]|nr:response regulator [Kofleriaceae bacterium]
MRDVLVIDDSATVRKLVEITLRGRSLRPHFADSGSEGIRCATALAPSAILLDFMLPDMTGVDVCRALAADSRTQSIPILVVTAKHERTRSEFQPFPAVVDFIGKPFAAPDLIARIDRAIAAGVSSARSGEPRRDPGERAARLLFARLRDGLALLPAQLRSLEPGPIAPQLARKLLTPQVVEGILADLRPLCAELAETEARRPRPIDSIRPRPVVILEPDVAAFEQPLRELLAERATPRELIAVGRVDDIASVARQRHPCLVLINATAHIAEACAVAHALRRDLALSDLAMVAVVEPRTVPPPDLVAAGFDAVLAKPLPVGELERFLNPADLR